MVSKRTNCSSPVPSCVVMVKAKVFPLLGNASVTSIDELGKRHVKNISSSEEFVADDSLRLVKTFDNFEEVHLV